MLAPDSISDLPVVSFSEGEEIIQQGSRPDKLFFLKSGKVEVVREEIRVSLIKTPGSVLGELSLLLDIDATATVKALEDATLFVSENPLEYLKSHPELHLHVSKALAYRLNAATRYLVDVKEQLKGCSDHVGMVDGVLDAIIHKDLKKKIA